jgi:hypothetical protein
VAEGVTQGLGVGETLSVELGDAEAEGVALEERLSELLLEEAAEAESGTGGELIGERVREHVAVDVGGGTGRLGAEHGSHRLAEELADEDGLELGGDGGALFGGIGGAERGGVERLRVRGRRAALRGEVGDLLLSSRRRGIGEGGDVHVS